MNNLTVIGDYEFDLHNQQAWNNQALSDAAHFDQNHYQLTVMAASEHFVKKMMEEPEILHDRLHSISLITDAKHRTFLSLQGGFVVKVPGECVFAAYYRDTYAKNILITQEDKENIDKENVKKNEANKTPHSHLIEEIARLNQNFHLYTPEEIVKGSRPDEINEIDAIGSTILLGDKKPKQIEITGVYMKISEAAFRSLQFESQLPKSDLTAPRSKTIKAQMKKAGVKPVNDRLRHLYATLQTYADTQHVPFIFIPN